MSQGVEVSGQAVPSPRLLPIAPAGPPWTRRRRGLTVEDAVDNLSDRSGSAIRRADSFEAEIVKPRIARKSSVGSAKCKSSVGLNTALDVGLQLGTDLRSIQI